MQENRGVKKDIMIYAILAAIIGYLGLSGFTILLFIYPAFSIALGKKYGLKQNIFNLISSGVAIVVVSGIEYLPIIGLFSLMSIVMGISIENNEKISSSISKGTGVIFIGMVLSFFILFQFYNINFMEVIGKGISAQSKEVINLLKENTPNNGDALKTIDSSIGIIESTIEVIKATIPSILLIGVFIGVFITYQSAYLLLKKNKQNSLKPIKMSNFRMNKNYSFGITLGIIVMFTMYFIDKNIYDRIFLNMSILIFILMFFQGIGIIAYLFDKLKFNGIFKYILFVLSIIFSFLMVLISFVGMTDMLFNFRKIKD